jgi:hypothetical protein
MSIVRELSCSYCGAPIPFKPGEIIATCRYCGYTVVIETGKAFTFEHSMLLNKYNPSSVEEPARDWMRFGFLKPSDLAKKAVFVEKTLMYLPFWIVSVDVESLYRGVFERLNPPVVKEGRIAKKYDWLVLARKVSDFPTRGYDVPLEGKVPYDFRRIEGFAKVLNSEIDREEAVQIAKQQTVEHHRYLAQQDVDRIIEMRDKVKVNQTVYLHAPVWLLKYNYKNKVYTLWLDGATGTVIKGEIPQTKVGLF